MSRYHVLSSVQTLSRVRLCDPMECSKPGLLVHHEFEEFTQMCFQCIGDAIQLSHPLLSNSPPAFKLSQHQGFFFQMSQLFASGGPNSEVSASTSVLQMNTQDLSPLERTGWISLQSKGLSRVFSNTTVQKL